MAAAFLVHNLPWVEEKIADMAFALPVIVFQPGFKLRVAGNCVFFILPVPEHAGRVGFINQRAHGFQTVAFPINEGEPAGLQVIGEGGSDLLRHHRRFFRPDGHSRVVDKDRDNRSLRADSRGKSGVIIQSQILAKPYNNGLWHG